MRVKEGILRSEVQPPSNERLSTLRNYTVAVRHTTVWLTVSDTSTNARTHP